jgi:hypothetical protein
MTSLTHLLGGYYNAEHQYWGSSLISPKDRGLYQPIQEKYLEILSTGEPTYWPTDIKNISDLLDFFTSKRLSHNSLDTRPNLLRASGHTTIIATISIHIVTHEKSPKLHNSQNNWEALRTQIEENLDSTSRPVRRETSKRILLNSKT